MILLLSFESSTQVTKSSRFLSLCLAAASTAWTCNLPRYQKGWIGDHFGANAHVLLLNQLRRVLQVLRHAQPVHHDAQPPSAERGHGDLVLDIAQLSLAAAAGAQYPHL